MFFIAKEIGSLANLINKKREQDNFVHKHFNFNILNKKNENINLVSIKK